MELNDILLLENTMADLRFLTEDASSEGILKRFSMFYRMSSDRIGQNFERLLLMSKVIIPNAKKGAKHSRDSKYYEMSNDYIKKKLEINDVQSASLVNQVQNVIRKSNSEACKNLGSNLKPLAWHSTILSISILSNKYPSKNLSIKDVVANIQERINKIGKSLSLGTRDNYKFMGLIVFTLTLMASVLIYLAWIKKDFQSVFLTSTGYLMTINSFLIGMLLRKQQLESDKAVQENISYAKIMTTPTKKVRMTLSQLLHTAEAKIKQFNKASKKEFDWSPGGDRYKYTNAAKRWMRIQRSAANAISKGKDTSDMVTVRV